MSPALADGEYETVADLFGMLSAPTRLRIVCALIEGERNVSELLQCVAVSQPNMSQQLGMLYRGGVLSRRRTGAQIYYRVAHSRVRELCEALMNRPASATTTSRPRRSHAPAP